MRAEINIGARLAKNIRFWSIIGAFAVIATVVAIIGIAPGHSLSKAASAPTVESVMSFTSMAGVDDSFINNTSVRGVKGDELPWDVGTVNGSLSTEGHLQLSVTGVVFSDDPRVPPELRGINDEDQFRAVVSCLTNASHGHDTGDARGHGQVATRNIFTDGFAATMSGNSNIDAMITLPNPCVAPIVFVAAGSEDKWFAVSGSYEEIVPSP
jgi:hypothetical protein